MFSEIDLNMLNSPEFKEDAVREEIIVPLLKKLGYKGSGVNRIIRSKTLTQPFIYVRTRKHPVKIIPDYTLLHEEKPVLILDAKSPSEDILKKSHIQQAYSYTIHPEIRCNNFALCNGHQLVVFSIEQNEPLMNLSIDKFDEKWDEIEKFLAPKYLINPKLRKFAPDFGLKLKRMGVSTEIEMVMLGVQLNLFAKVSEDLFTATANCELAGIYHCVSFDFSPSLLEPIVEGLPQPLAEQFLCALKKAPFQAAAELAIEIDITAQIGKETKGASETFFPLIIKEVHASRLNHKPLPQRPDDIPSHIFKLRDAFNVKYI